MSRKITRLLFLTKKTEQNTSKSITKRTVNIKLTKHPVGIGITENQFLNELKRIKMEKSNILIYFDAITSNKNFGDSGVYGFNVYENGIEIDSMMFSYKKTITTNQLYIMALKEVLTYIKNQYNDNIEVNIISHSTYVINGYNTGFKKVKANKLEWDEVNPLKRTTTLGYHVPANSNDLKLKKLVINLKNVFFMYFNYHPNNT